MKKLLVSVVEDDSRSRPEVWRKLARAAESDSKSLTKAGPNRLEGQVLAADQQIARAWVVRTRSSLGARTSSAEGSIQCPSKLGLRFSTKARRPSLWSRVCAVLTIFSAS